MIEFPPYNPYEQHSPYSADLMYEAQEQKELDNQFKKLYKAIDRAELNLLICDIMISQEKPTQEVINGFANKIEEIFKND